MRVTNNMITSNTKSNINANKVLVDKYNTQMTTQKKINKPSDDPVIAIRSLRMQTSLSHIDQYLNNNISDANSWLNVTDTALENMKTILTDVRSLCVKGATDTLKEDDRRTILNQLKSLSDQIYAEGCSAGGHLAASLGVFWHESWISERAGVTNEILRPAGLILCYPVITSGEYAHRGSFEALLKGQKTEEMLEKVSLEKQVTEHMPPVFLWHTFTDDCVPVENSLLLIAAMRKVNVPVEFHMYPAGGHGLSTCTEQSMNVDGYGVQEQCQSWLPLVRTWLAEKVRCKTDTNVLG